MGMSKDCKSQIMKNMTGKSQQINISSNCYIGLLSAAPSYDRVDNDVIYNTHELSGAGYKRMLIGGYQTAASPVMSDIDDNGTSVNEGTIFFPEAEGDWGAATYFALFNSEEGGSPHLWGALTSAVTISAGYVPIFKPGSLSITIN